MILQHPIPIFVLSSLSSLYSLTLKTKSQPSSSCSSLVSLSRPTPLATGIGYTRNSIPCSLQWSLVRTGTVSISSCLPEIMTGITQLLIPYRSGSEIDVLLVVLSEERCLRSKCQTIQPPTFSYTLYLLSLPYKYHHKNSRHSPENQFLDSNNFHLKICIFICYSCPPPICLEI